MDTYYTTFKTAMGSMLIAGNRNEILAVSWRHSPEKTWIKDNTRFRTFVKAIQDYFQGDMQALESLDWRMAKQGTRFQNQVWKQLSRIPPGKTRSYGQIAKALGKPGASRAVGGACGANPLPLLIPCHRVLGSQNSLGGFSAGIARKKFLLKLENIHFKN